MSAEGKSPPVNGPAHIETRLLVVAEMLERAVAEVRRAMAEIKSGDGSTVPPDLRPHAPDQEGR